ncbi:MAG: Trk family potassium uptake protein [Myxococcales bacterium]|nr:Trk family potassium uptake protein [Myxococcales bacterium]
MPKTVERWQGIFWLASLPLLFEILRDPHAPWWSVLPAFIFLFLMFSLSTLALYRSFLRSYRTFAWFRQHIIEVTLFLTGPPLMMQSFSWVGILLFLGAIVFGQTIYHDKDFRRLWAALLNRPSLLLVASFGTLIFVGAFLLMLPISSTKEPHDFLTALFTATSATCVTGLAIKDTGADFTFFGQCVILVLIQIGGLGIITFSSFILWFMGQRLGIRSRSALSAILDEQETSRTLGLLRFLVAATLIVESFGALLLFIAWYKPTLQPWDVAYRAIFHAISAFCNAGFALHSQSLVPYQKDVLVNLTVIGLILIGGTGFPVLASLLDPERLRQFRKRIKQQGFSWATRLFVRTLPLNTKIVLVFQFVFVFGIAIVFFFLEYGHSLGSLGFFQKIQAALFQSVTLRTAGFNTVDFSLLTPATLLIMMFTMFVGGASGGTAGGIKLNTIAILGLMLRNLLKGREQIEIFGRTLVRDNLARATGIITIFVMIFFFFSFLLLATQRQIPFSYILFEVTSAIGTVGLTTASKTGVSTTSLLDGFGQLCIIVLMFLGRLGPLTVAFAITSSPTVGRYQYPQERIYVG